MSDAQQGCADVQPKSSGDDRWAIKTYLITTKKTAKYVL